MKRASITKSRGDRCEECYLDGFAPLKFSRIE
jgi:hypothetical protein